MGTIEAGHPPRRHGVKPEGSVLWLISARRAEASTTSESMTGIRIHQDAVERAGTPSSRCPWVTLPFCSVPWPAPALLGSLIKKAHLPQNRTQRRVAIAAFSALLRPSR
jgi:hypothetical protein